MAYAHAELLRLGGCSRASREIDVCGARAQYQNLYDGAPHFPFHRDQTLRCPMCVLGKNACFGWVGGWVGGRRPTHTPQLTHAPFAGVQPSTARASSSHAGTSGPCTSAHPPAPQSCHHPGGKAIPSDRDFFKTGGGVVAGGRGTQGRGTQGVASLPKKGVRGPLLGGLFRGQKISALHAEKKKANMAQTLHLQAGPQGPWGYPARSGRPTHPPTLPPPSGV